MASITVQPEFLLERILTLEIVRVTERAAVSSARLRGRGQEKAADQAAVDAMRRELNKLPIDGTVVIGEGEIDEAPMLFIGEKVGNKHGPKVDIAVDPLEGTTLCAKNMPGAIATIAMADGGTLLHSPDCYMDKIAIGHRDCGDRARHVLGAQGRAFQRIDRDVDLGSVLVADLLADEQHRRLVDLAPVSYTHLTLPTILRV